MNTEQLLMQIIRRQNAMLDMMSDFMRAYAKVNNMAIQEVEEEEEWIDDIGRIDN